MYHYDNQGKITEVETFEDGGLRETQTIEYNVEGRISRLLSTYYNSGVITFYDTIVYTYQSGEVYQTANEQTSTFNEYTVVNGNITKRVQLTENGETLQTLTYTFGNILNPIKQPTEANPIYFSKNLPTSETRIITSNNHTRIITYTYELNDKGFPLKLIENNENNTSNDYLLFSYDCD